MPEYDAPIPRERTTEERLADLEKKVAELSQALSSLSRAAQPAILNNMIIGKR